MGARQAQCGAQPFGVGATDDPLVVAATVQHRTQPPRRVVVHGGDQPLPAAAHGGHLDHAEPAHADLEADIGRRVRIIDLDPPDG